LFIEEVEKRKDAILKQFLPTTSIVHTQVFDVNKEAVDDNYDTLANCVSDKDDVLTIIIHFGVNAGTKVLHMEKNAINYLNDGDKSGKIEEDGPKLYSCKINLEELNEKLDLDLVKISLNAGTYYCNYIYYKSSYRFISNTNVKPVFFHVPNVDRIDTEGILLLFILIVQELERTYM